MMPEFLYIIILTTHSSSTVGPVFPFISLSLAIDQLYASTCVCDYSVSFSLVVNYALFIPISSHLVTVS
jgi:hypothetical protein